MPGRWNLSWSPLYTLAAAGSAGGSAFDVPGRVLLAASYRLVDADSTAFTMDLEVREDGAAGGWEQYQDINGNSYVSETPSVETISKTVWLMGQPAKDSHGIPMNNQMRLTTTLVGGTNGSNTADVSILTGSSGLLYDFSSIVTYEMFNNADLPDGSTKTFASLGNGDLEGRAFLLGLYHQGNQGAAPPTWSVVLEVQDPLTSTWNRLRDTSGALVAAVSGTTAASLNAHRECGTGRTGPYFLIPPGSRLIYDGGGADDHELQVHAVIGIPSGS